MPRNKNSGPLRSKGPLFLRKDCFLCGGSSWTAIPISGLFRCRCGIFRREGPVYPSELDRLPAVIEARRPLHAALLRQLGAPSGRRLLDVGCGTGQFLDLASAAGWRASGLEPDPAGARAAQERGLDVRVCGLRAASASEEGVYDVAACWDVLDLSEDPAEDLREVFRLLRPGGRLWVRVRNAPFNAALMRWGLGLSPLGTLHRHGFGAAQLERALRACGFDKVVFHRSPAASPGPYLEGLGPAARLLVRWAANLAPTAVLARADKPGGEPRVLHLITRLDPGGSAASVMSTAGRRSGDATLVAAGPGRAGVPSGVRAIPDLVRDLRPARDLRAFLQILGLLKEFEPDVLHTHTSKAGFLGRWAAWLYNRGSGGVRTVHTPHGPVFEGYFGPPAGRAVLWLERASAAITDRLIAVSPAELRESLARGVGRPGQWRNVPGGVEVRPAAPEGREPARRALGFSGECLVVGTAARLEPVKGVRHLVEAAAAVRSKLDGLRLLIIGEGGERAALESLAAGLGLGGDVVFTGWRRDVRALLPAIDVYVQPSLSEGFGWAALEAQAAGLPVIASSVGGLTDLVKEGETGLLVPAGDCAALAAALSRCLSDPLLRIRLGSEAAAAARVERFGPQAAAEGLEAVYEELVRP